MENNNTDKAMAQEFTVTGMDFMRMVQAVKPAVDTDRDSELGCVHAVVRDGRLCFEGTDRYKIMFAYAREVESTGCEDLNVSIPLSEVKRVLQMVKATDKANREGMRLTWRVSANQIEGPCGVVSYEQWDYPAVYRFVPAIWDAVKAGRGDAVRGRAYNPKFFRDVMGGFAAAYGVEALAGVRFYESDKMAGFTFGLDAMGVLMPIRSENSKPDFYNEYVGGSKASKAKVVEPELVKDTATKAKASKASKVEVVKPEGAKPKATRKVAKAKVVKAKATKEAKVTKAKATKGAKVTKAKATKEAKVTKAKATKGAKKLQGRTAKESATLLRKALYREYRNGTRFMVKREGERRSVARVVWAGGPEVSEVEAFVKPFTAEGSGLTGAVFERTDATV